MVVFEYVPQALLENLFMILVSILNKIPIFIIGKPGSSKSLAMELVQSNLNGEGGSAFFLRSFRLCCEICPAVSFL